MSTLAAKFATATAGLALVVAGVVGVGAPAYADWYDCPSGKICVWEHEYGEGAMVGSKYDSQSYKDLSLWDRADSWWNRGRYCEKLINWRNGQPEIIDVLQPGQSRGRLLDVSTRAHDTADGIMRC